MGINAVIQELETQRNMFAARCAQLANELDDERQKAKANDAKPISDPSNQGTPTI